MPTRQGNLSLLEDPVAQRMLASATPARFSYIGTDGAPRVVPIWFHWDGNEVVMGTPGKTAKVKALKQNPKVALTIDGDSWPYPVLLIRGTASVKTSQSAPTEYAAAARRYLGDEAGQGWVNQANAIMAQWARIAIQPEWVGVMDFEQRFPNRIEEAMEAAAST